MGIAGLLGALKEVMAPSHARDFRGQTVAVDALSWLHKACYGCAWDLAVGNETETYVKYILRRTDMLKAVGVKPLLVFDGNKIPLKSSTHDKRRSAKQENHDMAMQHLREARSLVGDERKEKMAKTSQYFQRSINITSAIIASVHDALRKANVEFVTAPFEADAQMVFLCKHQVTTAIITEDSDILVYCAAANISVPVLFKLEETGDCKMLSKDAIHTHGKTSANGVLRKLSYFLSGGHEPTRMFVHACILAGCDFLDSLHHIGIVRAIQHVFDYRGVKGTLRIPRLLSKLKFDGATVPDDYLERFYKAEALFYHHYVYDPSTQCCVHLVTASDYEVVEDIFERVTASLTETPFLGILSPQEVIRDIYNNKRLARSDASESSSQSSSQPSQSALSTQSSQPSQSTGATQNSEPSQSSLSQRAPSSPKQQNSPASQFSTSQRAPPSQSFQSPPPRATGRRWFGAHAGSSPEATPSPAVAKRPVFKRQPIDCDEVRAKTMESIFSVYAAPSQRSFAPSFGGIASPVASPRKFPPSFGLPAATKRSYSPSTRDALPSPPAKKPNLFANVSDDEDDDEEDATLSGAALHAAMAVEPTTIRTVNSGMSIFSAPKKAVPVPRLQFKSPTKGAAVQRASNALPPTTKKAVKTPAPIALPKNRASSKSPTTSQANGATRASSRASSKKTPPIKTQAGTLLGYFTKTTPTTE
ncbi:hypothetical protein SDRG_10164 [Saprolegnia diclina VS20]|uniref:Exonuclease 1 n=1 Tax=Saprolegnia diclina (strain VS20) TaxID=1156394 RepID=T0Q3M9_SAPDV|nr:hypothetical protein SDRG_10164 [Saprolegnia diclina VS20]EQC32424.1 hypothetical protein SDRG_10164 [Saprolegnia diclina VS20]|eukprot:XP_008614365.1 hypothetical protein SDRG_10164 [Saprolegnia diclina VS20]